MGRLVGVGFPTGVPEFLRSEGPNGAWWRLNRGTGENSDAGKREDGGRPQAMGWGHEKRRAKCFLLISDKSCESEFGITTQKRGQDGMFAPWKGDRVPTSPVT